MGASLLTDGICCQLSIQPAEVERRAITQVRLPDGSILGCMDCLHGRPLTDRAGATSSSTAVAYVTRLAPTSAHAVRPVQLGTGYGRCGSHLMQKQSYTQTWRRIWFRNRKRGDAGHCHIAHQLVADTAVRDVRCLYFHHLRLRVLLAS